MRDGNSSVIGIGALADACGVPESTLRTWERRYGFPAPSRTAGNHRLYSLDTLDRLRWVRTAIDRGHRPGTALRLSLAELHALLDPSAARPSEPRTVAGVAAPEGWETWRGAVASLDEDLLTRLLHREASRFGTIDFLEDRLAPMLEEVGTMWADGSLGEAQEHFASERVRDFLTAQWRPLSASAEQPLIVCATLPDAQHTLGLHMAAWTAALAGARLLFLGVGLPLEEIVGAVRRVGARGLLVSVAAGPEAAGAHDQLVRLRAHVGTGTELLTGGAGAPRVEGTTHAAGLRDIVPWVERLAPER